MDEDELKSLREQLAAKTREAEYYKKLAQEAAKKRLRETETLSKLTSTLREKLLVIEEQQRRLEGLNRKIERVSVTDELTGLLNRRGFVALGDREFAGMLRRSHGGTFEPLACAILDVDHFKRVNDAYGHSAGDAVLSRLGALFQRPGLLRKTDIVGRYGGEEFAFVMPSCTERSACVPLGRLWSAIQDMKIDSPPDTEIRITVSIGISQATSQDKGVFDVLSRADKALYYAKNHGRNRIVGYEQCCEELACVPPHALTN